VTGTADPGSFRDPAGFVFRRAGTLYRQVNQSYASTFEQLERAGFLRALQDDGLLIAHNRLGAEAASTPDAFAVLQPDLIPFVSYPYEWCFGQLKDAALLTLELQRRALDAGFILRDGSAYNVQFRGGRAIFVDTLSFSAYRSGQPWYAYGQFCAHFLAPLALIARCDPRLGALQRSLPDGIPLDLASRLLGMRSWVRPALLLHVHLHAAARRRYARDTAAQRDRSMSLAALRRLIDHLRLTVERLSWKPGPSEWSDYESEHDYTPDATRAKEQALGEMLQRIQPRTVWDLGANTGMYSAVAANSGARVVAIDSDHAAVERHYHRTRLKSDLILPLVIDLRNPSPSLGWAHAERQSLAERGPADVALALALVHHLVLGGGIPLPWVAKWLASVSRAAIVEFVPPDDPQVRRLLAGRTERTHEYSEAEFRRAFDVYFTMRERRPLPGSGRMLYALDRTDATA
jgi:hypothetical protein